VAKYSALFPASESIACYEDGPPSVCFVEVVRYNKTKSFHLLPPPIQDLVLGMLYVVVLKQSDSQKYLNVPEYNAV
jgi:hypothetical protein